ncbi:MAG TPA: ornithine cyclodeaminase family protein [Gemmatimonadaceae bacterium]|nr:ornithine cyclodeaminase family protein [Gemmatimonadaceae bacterium]
MTLVLSGADVRRLVPIAACIDSVEHAFLQHARGRSIPPAVVAAHVAHGGFHVKAAGLLDVVNGRPLFAAKINANFPANPDAHGLPTIQGVIALFDAADGRVLALLDSIEITSLRTAAATAVAAKYLAPPVATVAIIGCGAQSRYQLRALACVRPLARVTAIDLRADRASRFVRDVSAELGVDASVAPEPAAADRDTNVWITCTPARRWFLGREHVRAGSFVAAVGADNPDKQEIEPALMASGAVVADVLDQCERMGDLHHAIETGVMRRGDVRAELAGVVAGITPGRLSANETVIFDSTGTALQDAAAAALAFDRARASGAGLAIDLAGPLAAASVRRDAGVPA